MSACRSSVEIARGNAVAPHAIARIRDDLNQTDGDLLPFIRQYLPARLAAGRSEDGRCKVAYAKDSVIAE
jgi:hypothetical protein